MSNQTTKRHRFSDEFKLRMLQEYYQSGSSKYSICKKYGVDDATFLRWVREFESESLSLPEELSELETQVYMSRKRSTEKNELSEMTALEKLQEENRRLRKALSYSELRNEALNEVLKIGRERYGIDLLKKAGARQ